MDFKLFLEIAEIKPPSGKVKFASGITFPGTNNAHPNKTYTFTTKLGNQVRLKFDMTGKNEAFVIFSVNDRISTDHAGIQDPSQRDPEILSGVFHLIKTKAKALKLKRFYFTAESTAGDIKTHRNLPIEPAKTKALKSLDKFIHFLKNEFTPTLKVYDDGFKEKFFQIHKKLPVGYDVHVEKTIDSLEIIKKLIEADRVHPLENAIDNANFYYIEKQLGSKYNVKELCNDIKNIRDALMSNTEKGLQVHRNRRKVIYEKLCNRYFQDDWNINISNNHFEFIKKENQLPN